MNRWHIFDLFAAAYLVAIVCLWQHRNDDAGQAMPMDDAVFLGFGIAGGVALLGLWLLLWIV